MTLPSEELINRRYELESRLQNMIQLLDPEEEHTTTILERTCTLAKAELYRLTALLYLQRICPIEGDSISRKAYLGQAFNTLEVLPAVSSLWPLFIIAGESQSDEQRITILQVLNEMEKARNIGNIYVIRQMIEMFWKQKDLGTGLGPREQLMCWRLIDSDVSVPWFA